MSMHTLLHQLASRYGLSGDQAGKLWDLAGTTQPPEHLSVRLHTGLAALAGLLCGAGLIFWVAANWAEQSRAFRLTLLEAAVLAPALVAVALPRARAALLLLSTLALGGLLAFVGQTYQTGADAWQLFATWVLLALPWALAVRRDAFWALWVLIAGTGILMWSGRVFTDPFFMLARQSYLDPIARLLWILLFALPLLLPRLRAVGGAGARLSWRLAALMALGAWSADGILALIADGPGTAMLDILLCAGAFAVALAPRTRDLPILGFALLALNLLALWTVGYHLFANAGSGGETARMALLTLLAIALLGGSGTWLYRLQRRELGV